MSRQTRRSFLKKTAAASLGASFVIAGTKASGRVIGANDKIRVGVAGIHGRGNSHIADYLRKDVEIAYLIDPDSRLFAGRTDRIKEKSGNTPKCVADVRKALDDKNLDAISIATPNHWHSLMAIWGCQAGKHVYVEKPCTHNVYEGGKLIEASKKYGVIVQHGTQQRSDQGRANEMAALNSGKYGEVLVAKGYCCKPRWSIGFKENKQPPKEVDFNLWLGPAPMQPYHENLVHYNWHWFWDTGNGDMGNQGVHQTDVALWGLGKDQTLPNSVWSLGGRWVNEPDWKDQGETPNMLMSVFDFGGPLVVFETRGLVAKKPKGATKEFPRKVDNEFYTTEGVMISGTFYPKGGKKPEKVKYDGPKVTPGGPFGSFLAAVRSGKQEDVNAPINKGHYASAICHLGNVSYRLGSNQPFSKKPKYLGSDERVLKTLEIIKENLSGVGVKLDETEYCLGPVLKIDPKAGKFVGDHAEAANKLLTREYRKGFVVPEKV
ncbi:MAG: Gfo/Idh/MocA family oxidoreductase [Pirellulales bacterium]|nr:Gfo/Idh/MocA family oxidoreductase [Pirellulales bacterium]